MVSATNVTGARFFFIEHSIQLNRLHFSYIDEKKSKVLNKERWFNEAVSV
jgi:hypothetical protein